MEGLGNLHRDNLHSRDWMVVDESTENAILWWWSMNIVAATIIYFVLMFSTIFSWFVLGRFIVDIMVLMSGAVSMDEVTQVTQNCVYATNFMFILFLIVWTVWFVYVAHSSEYEQTYYTRKY